MKKVAIIGPIDSIGRHWIQSGLNDIFEIVTIESEDEYPLKLPDIDYAVLRTLKLSAQDIQIASNIKFIQRWGVGYDSVDIVAAGARGIQVAVLPGVNAIPVAEYTIMLMLSVMRNLIPIHNNAIKGLPRDDSLIASSYVLYGKTVGLVGLGNIGKKVATIVKSFGAQVIYYDKYRLEPEEEESLGIAFAELNALASTSDIISIHVPLVRETVNLVDGKLLDKMKPTTVLINTARGGIVDEQALFEALRDKKILAAGLDVFANEPLAANHPITTLDNVIVSAHCAGNTIDNSAIMGRLCAENILKVSRGDRLSKPDLVNEEYLK